MKILIDTNFIMRCVDQKIELLDFNGGELKILVADKVLEELEKLSISRNKKVVDRNLARLSLAVLDSYSGENVEKINFRIENVDDAIVDFCKRNPEVILATLDNLIKSKVENKILTIVKRKILEVKLSKK